MRKNLVYIFIGIILFTYGLSRYKGCVFIERVFKTRAAAARVHAVLQGIQMKRDGSGTVGDEQLAIARWYSDLVVITDPHALNAASDGFDRWRRQAGKFYIDDYTIDEIKIQENRDADDEEEGAEEKPYVFIVSGTINFGPFIMRVPEGDTISWLRAPW